MTRSIRYTDMLKFFDYGHLPEEFKDVSEHFHSIATNMCDLLPESAETTACLRKLLEAKDCAVRSMVEATRPHHLSQ